MIIAIDGPSGAGKSTVAQAVARRLGFACLDTGAMYRAIAWKALHDGVDLDDAEALGAIARASQISLSYEIGESQAHQLAIDGLDITRDIRSATIDRAVSSVSALPAVRAALGEQQRRIGNQGNYVVEGRDIGTVVFPDAACKIFLTASAEERARRRLRQNTARGIGSLDFETVYADILRRDRLDEERATSPLKPADDARILDATDLCRDEVVSIICEAALSASAS